MGVRRHSLTARATQALNWRILSSISMFGTQFIVNIILARLLPVEAFGLLGLAMLVMGFANVIAGIGITPALVQQRNLSDVAIRVGFTLSTLSGIILVVVLWFIAPIAVNLFNVVEIVPILRVLSFTFLFKSVSSTSLAILQRQMNFRKLFWVELISYVIGYILIGIPLGLMGQGVWTLVWAALIQSAIRTILLIVNAPHHRKPSFSLVEAKQLLHFGTGSSLARVVNYLARNADYFVIGRWLNPWDLGIYMRAYQLMTMPISQFSSAIGAVLFPAYAEIQNDQERLKKAYTKTVLIVFLIIIPILTSMIISAPELILVVYGPKWEDVILPFQILSIGGIGRAMYNLADTFARAKGAVYEQFMRHSLYAILIFLLSLLGVRWGISGVAVGVVLAISFMTFMMVRLVNKLGNCTWKETFFAQIPGFLIAGTIMVVVWPIVIFVRFAHLPNIIILILATILYVIIWGAFFLFMPGDKFQKARYLAYQWIGQVNIPISAKIIQKLQS